MAGMDESAGRVPQRDGQRRNERDGNSRREGAYVWGHPATVWLTEENEIQVQQ